MASTKRRCCGDDDQQHIMSDILTKLDLAERSAKRLRQELDDHKEAAAAAIETIDVAKRLQVIATDKIDAVLKKTTSSSSAEIAALRAELVGLSGRLDALVDPRGRTHIIKEHWTKVCAAAPSLARPFSAATSSDGFETLNVVKHIVAALPRILSRQCKQ